MKKRFLKKFFSAIILLIFIPAFLFVYLGSLRYTQIFYQEGKRTYPSIFQPHILDNIKMNILFEFALVVILCVIILFVKRYLSSRVCEILSAILGLFTFLFSLLFVLSAKVVPIDDAAEIQNAAHSIIIGKGYDVFAKESYITRYPNNLGLVMVFIILERFTDILKLSISPNTLFQIINSFIAGLIVYLIHKVSLKTFKCCSLSLIASLLTALFFPLSLFTVFQYGETLSIALLCTAILIYFEITNESKEAKIIYYFLLFAVLSFAVAIRANSIIIIVALICISIANFLFRKKDKKEFLLISILLVSMILSIFLPQPLLKEVVFRDTYIPHDSMPPIMWINIGLGDGSGFGYGTYDGHAAVIWEESGYSSKLSGEICAKEINERLVYLKDNNLLWTFLYEKTLWQWISPDYSAMCYANQNEPGFPNGIAYQIMYGDSRQTFFNIMDLFQSFIYLMIIIGGISLAICKSNFSNYIFIVIGLGGFLFHLIWEASPRYIYPYIVLMIPLAAYAIYAQSSVLIFLINKLRTRKSERKNKIAQN